MKRMADVLRVLFFCAISVAAQAQYVPNSNQPFQFAPVINPAFTGIEGFKDIKLSYRYQWSGFGGDAPKFINIAYNFRIKEPLDLTLHALRTTPAVTRRKKDDIPTLKKVIHGLGVNVFNETIGPISRMGGGLHYAFHYPLSNTTRLSFGVGAIVDNTKVNTEKLYLGIGGVDPDPFITRLVNDGANHTELNVRAGVRIYSPKFYFGLTYFPVVYQPLKTSEFTVEDPFYRGSAQAGVAFNVTPTIELRPSVLALWQVNNEFVIDYNIKMFVEQKLWFGVTYRDIQSLVGILGFNLNEMLGAAYSYEISLNGMQQFSDGSHELVLSLRLNNFKRLSQRTW
jgi:type IX secretion system PorP/SprF family membrane protein